VRTLVTGATGFIGAALVEKLLARGDRVRALVRATSRTDELARLGVELAPGALSDASSLAAAVEGCDAVFHLAAVYSYHRRDAAAMEAVNVEGTRAVLAAATRGSRRRIVITSSCATCGPVRGRPATEADAPPEWELRVPYKRTKLAAERLALDAAAEGHDVVVVNPTTPVGPGDRRPTPTGKMVADVGCGRARAYLAGGALNVVAVEDVAIGHLRAHERGRRGERYLLGGENLAMREVFAIVAAAAGRRPPRVGIPWAVASLGAHVADAALRAVGRQPSLLVLDQVRLARLPMVFDDTKARRELGHRSRPAAEALSAAARAAVGVANAIGTAEEAVEFRRSRAA
jgi:dihydroflavonol-4-reductase